MEITPQQILDQWNSVPSLVQYVWLREEARASLPKYMLAAVASRETNMSAEYWQGTVGDFGHGHGSFQYDDRSHSIPGNFDRDPNQQAYVAAWMLHNLFKQYGVWQMALAAYNSGQPSDIGTTHHNYGMDVFSRYLILSEHFTTLRMLRFTTPFMRGNDVKFMQHAMNTKRYPGTPLNEDGVYGIETENVVMTFQARHGLLADGILGPLTYAEMAAY